MPSPPCWVAVSIRRPELMDEPFGRQLPSVAAPPGPRSRELYLRLAAVESRNITSGEPLPIAWAEAAGANVRDADGNVYIDLTAGFSVAAAGHAPPEVADAIAGQARRLPHALGDVHPAEPKVRLLERLAELAPGDLSVSILGSAGAEAVEAALKTARLATGRPGILAFEGGYHGLTYGALAATHRTTFREPFQDQLFPGVRFAPYPAAPAEVAGALESVERALGEASASATPVGAVLVEPIQGRGGIIPAPEPFLQTLRALCSERNVILIFDEVYTGFGRTGRWFACEHAGVVPDILVVGKALSGALPVSAAVGAPDVMAAWPAGQGEAIHTSTFLGNPVACAAALAQLDLIEKGNLVARAAAQGASLQRSTEGWVGHRAVTAVRGRGLMQGVVLREPDGRPGTERARGVVERALAHGVIMLAEGPHADVLALTPPLVVSEAQLGYAVEVIDGALSEMA